MGEDGDCLTPSVNHSESYRVCPRKKIGVCQLGDGKVDKVLLVGMDPSINLFENRLRRQGVLCLDSGLPLIVLPIIISRPQNVTSLFEARAVTGLSRLRDYTREVRTVMVLEVVTVWPFASVTVRVTV